MISHFKILSRGFTLLEILVVLILISLATSLVATNVGSSSDHKRTLFFIRQVQSMCRKARHRAMINGYPQTFVISSSSRVCWVVKESKVEIPSSITIEGENIETEDQDIYKIMFYTDGSSSGGQLFFKSEEKSLAILKVDVMTGIIELNNEQT